MSIMTDLRQQSLLEGALRAVTQSRAQPEKRYAAGTASDRVPLYSGGKLAAFVRRTPLSDTLCPPVFKAFPGESTDRMVERTIAARWQMEAGTPSSQIGIGASEGIVRLSGAVETVHDRMALCRIAAAMEETLAIIDELCVACE